VPQGRTLGAELEVEARAEPATAQLAVLAAAKASETPAPVRVPAQPQASAQVAPEAFERVELAARALTSAQAAEPRQARVEAAGVSARAEVAALAVLSARPEQAQATPAPVQELLAQEAAVATAQRRLARAAAAGSHPCFERLVASLQPTWILQRARHP